MKGVSPFFVLVASSWLSSALGKYMSIVGKWLPDANCDLDDPYNSSLIYGIEINLIKKVYTNLNWTEGEEYYFECMTWSQGWDRLYNYEDALWFPSLTCNSERMGNGMKFAQVS